MAGRGIGRGRGIPAYELEDEGPRLMRDDEEYDGLNLRVTAGRGRGILGRLSPPGIHERVVPEPERTIPEPVQVVPEPVQVVPEPVQVVPEPVQVIPEPIQVAPEEPVEAVLEQLVLEPVAEAAAAEEGDKVQVSVHSIPTTTSSVQSRAINAPTVATAPSSTIPPDLTTNASKWSTGSGREDVKPADPAPSAPAQEVPARAPIPSKPDRIKVVKRGTKGEPTALGTNFVRLKHVQEGKKIYEYHVEYEPPLDSTRMKKDVMRKIMEGRSYTFDGTMLFLGEKNNGDHLEFETLHPNTQEPMVVTATFVKEKQIKDLIQFFNILIRQIMRVLGRIQLRQNYYDVNDVKKLPQHRLDVWPGYCIAVEEMEGGLMVCLDASHRVLRQDTVLEQYTMMKGVATGWQEKFTEFIVGKIVLTRYNNACYKIDDIWWDSKPTDTFVKRGNEITYVRYYEEHYGVHVRNFEQPLLVSRIKPRRGDLIQEEKTVALVPELCYITGLTDDQRSNFTLMKDLGEHTRLTPAQRKFAMQKFIQLVTEHPEAKKILQDWNLEFDNAPLQMEGRLMAGPTLNFGKREVAVQADFSKDALSGVVNAQKVDKYLLICTQRDMPKARQFDETYRKVCRQLGIQTGAAATILPIKGFQVNDFRRAIKDNVTPEYQFLFCLMPQQRDDVYSLIKKLTLSELEIPSQCCLTKTLNNEKRFTSVVQKIALQINCKLGGALWALKMPFDTPIMFVGIDVAHDPKKKHPSVLGLVTTLNNECTKYASFCRILKVHQETADSLRSCFEEALDTFLEFRGRYPERIVVWRDGGMADPLSFNQHEVQQVQKAIYAKCQPDAKFSFVVVQKRIPQRFFKAGRLGQNWDNPSPGTVIDHTVTKYDAYDFYVVSQLVRQGTVTPTHYTVIADVGDTKPDLLQKFAYVCSFMYYNWPGTVRVPAMTQYAHKLAGLVGNNIRAPPGKTLRDALYYL